MKSAPHQAIVKISVEIMEKLHTGEVSGLPVKDNDLRTKYINVYGDNFEACKANVQKLLGKLNES